MSIKRHHLIKILTAIFLGVLSSVLVTNGYARGAPRHKLWVVKPSQTAQVYVDHQKIVRETFPDALFGFNINYRTLEEQIWDQNAKKMKADIEELLSFFTGALYRYPGGLIANGFDWEGSSKNYSRRKLQGTIFKHTPQKVKFGINEYFDFVEQEGGRFIYVLNLVGNDSSDVTKEADKDFMAAQNGKLARYIKPLASKLNQRAYYQLGNELDRHHFEWPVEKYIERSSASIQKIHEADPNAKIVAFFREFNWTYTDKKRGVSRAEDFMGRMLTELPEIEDYSLHHYYDGVRVDGQSRNLPFWLRLTNKSINIYKDNRKGQSPNIWITEHGRQKSTNNPNKDRTNFLSSNLGGAVSVADYLTAITLVPEIKGASLHGLNAGPWQLFDYSVKHRDLRPLPLYWALRVLRKNQFKKVLASYNAGPNTSKYAGGYDIRTVAFQGEGNDIAIWAINRSSAKAPLKVTYKPLRGQKISVKHYYLSGRAGIDKDSPLMEPKLMLDDTSVYATQADKSGIITLELPPSSVSTFILTGQ